MKRIAYGIATATFVSALVASPSQALADDGLTKISDVSIRECSSGVSQNLPRGWKVKCVSSGPQARADVISGTMFINSEYYQKWSQNTIDWARYYAGGAPLPTKFNRATRGCQKLINSMHKHYAKMVKEPWTVRCMDRSEMPRVDGSYSEKVMGASGLAYGSARVILIDAQSDSTLIKAIYHHEWGHALNQSISSERRVELERRYGLPWTSKPGDYWNNINEVMAQSYAECRGTMPAYPYRGIKCSQLKAEYARYGIKVDFGKRNNAPLAPGKRKA